VSYISEIALGVFERLGSTPEEVARTLQEEGIRGVRRSKCDCPIARYLQQHGFESAEVGFYVHVNVGKMCFLTPPHVKRFILDFDKGLYPELEEK
jgi:hypothetical protein